MKKPIEDDFAGREVASRRDGSLGRLVLTVVLMIAGLLALGWSQASGVAEDIADAAPALAVEPLGDAVDADPKAAPEPLADLGR